MIRPVSNATTGEVVEWFMAPVLKTGLAKANVGSNPTLSATPFPSTLDAWTALGIKG